VPPVKKHVRKPSGPATNHPTVVGFTVGLNGDIAYAPTMFEARSNDIVMWVVGNTSGEQITVTIKDFLRKKVFAQDDTKGVDAVKPFLWIGSNTLQLDNNETGIIAGRRDPDYGVGFLPDHVSYTITVTSASFDIDYDPDGDIKP